MKSDISMCDLHKQYMITVKQLKSYVRQLQLNNKEYKDCKLSKGKKYIYEKNIIDISIINSMIRDLEDDLRAMEYYIPYDKRIMLHKECESVKRQILSSYSHDGLNPMGLSIYSDMVESAEDVICNIELQDDIQSIMSETLTDKQEEIVRMYFYDSYNQEEIADLLGVSQQAVQSTIKVSLEKLALKINKNILNYF